MKKFNELALNITEQEYRENGRFHYSDIAGYIRDGFSYLVKPHKEESESLTFGSMVDCLITEGQDVFDEKYCISKEFNLSDNQKTAINDLLVYGYKNLSDIEPETINNILGQYYKNPKTQFTKLLEDGSEYYRFLYENKDKTPVDYQMYKDAIDVANVLLTNKNTEIYFNSKFTQFDRYFQLKFNGEYEGIPVCAMPDLILIDHESKQIWIVDLKSTCVNYEWEFPKSFVKYRYDCQGKLYPFVIRQNMDKDDFYKDYKIEGFLFIYISRINKMPLLWSYGNCFSNADILVETRNGNRFYLEDFRKPLKEMALIKSEQRTVPINIFPDCENDIMEHLYNF